MIRSAEDLRQIASQSDSRQENIELDRICEQLHEIAKLGYYEQDYYSKISNGVIEKLEKLGFTVKPHPEVYVGLDNIRYISIERYTLGWSENEKS